jgi:hypothetical protein
MDPSYGVWATPRSMMMAVTYFAGVTSNVGFPASMAPGALCLLPWRVIFLRAASLTEFPRWTSAHRCYG